VEFGLEVKERTAPRRVMTLAYANGRPGYIPHRSAYPAGGYEVDEAYRYYGYPACFAPEAGEAIVATAIDLVAEASTQ
jgi:neutral ceramidase